MANAERWKFNEESRCIHEEDWRGLALFEVLVATSDRQARTAAAAPAAIDLLRRLVADYDDEATYDTLETIVDAARPLLAAIDGAPAESEA